MPEESWPYSPTSVTLSQRMAMWVAHSNGCGYVKCCLETFWILPEHVFHFYMLLIKCLSVICSSSKEHYYDGESGTGYLAWRIKTIQRCTAKDRWSSLLSYYYCNSSLDTIFTVGHYCCCYYRSHFCVHFTAVTVVPPYILLLLLTIYYDCIYCNSVALLYMQHLLHACPSWDRDLSSGAHSEVSSTFFPCQKGFFGGRASFSSLKLRV